MTNRLFKIAVKFQENLGDYLRQNPDQYHRMSDIEQQSFEKYKEEADYDFAQDPDDIEDDFNQPGAKGIGITDDNGNVIGYVYGYNMTDDEFDVDPDINKKELQSQYGVKFYTNVPDNFAEQMFYLIQSGKIFYIANLALPSHKIKLMKMLQKMLQQLRNAGYQYVAFDALSDSMKLFMGEGYVPNAARMALFGVQIVAGIPADGNWEHAQVLIKI